MIIFDTACFQAHEIELLTTQAGYERSKTLRLLVNTPMAVDIFSNASFDYTNRT